MGRVRGHDPIVIEEFNGLWSRGDDESCPLDHMLLATNIHFIQSGIETRPAAAPYGNLTPFQADIRRTRRVYNFTTQKLGQTFLVMLEGGDIYHVVSPTDMRLIYSVATANDFAFIQIANRAYISPFRWLTTPTGENYQLGVVNDYLLVYDPDNGDGVARRAGGLKPSNQTFNPPFPPPTGVSDGGKKPMIAYNSDKVGEVTEGVHIITIVNNGGVGSPDASPHVLAPGDKMIIIEHIPPGPAGTTSRTITMTKAIDPALYSGADGAYNGQFYVVHTFNDNSYQPKFEFTLSDAQLTTIHVPSGGIPGTETGAMLLDNTETAGFNDPGFHLVGVVYESKSGFLSAPGPEFFAANTYINDKRAILVKNIPLGPSNIGGATPYKRHLVSTKTIPEYDGKQTNYQFFFIPGATLDETQQAVTEKLISYYDSDLVADASHLTENFTLIPAGVALCEYHSRLVIVGDGHYPFKEDGKTEDTTKPDNRSVAWVSAPGEPEAINQVDGLIVTPVDGNPLTHCQDFRDNLYLFKQNRTYSVVDNQDDPVTWGPVEVVDQGVGTCVHGIAEVLDSGGVNVNYLIVIDHSGLMLFNGTYARPELSWKIENVWNHFDKQSFHHFQIVNDTIRKKFWITHPNWMVNPVTSKLEPIDLLWMADYGNGLNPKDIRWALWRFQEVAISSVVLYKNDKLILGTYSPQGGFFGPGELMMINSTAWPPDDMSGYPKGITAPPFRFPIADPGPVIPEIAGGLLILDPTNITKHDVFKDVANALVNVPIQVNLRTALLGE